MKRIIAFVIAIAVAFCGCTKTEELPTESIITEQDNKLKVIITVDVEDKRGSEPNLIECEVDGKDSGVYYIMDAAEKHDARVVFFTNIYEHHQYDEEYMPALLKNMDSRGHEVALHSHAPHEDEWRLDWYTGTILRYNYDEQKHIIEYGCKYIEDATGKRPVSFRGGAYRVNDTTFKVLRDCGILYDSSQFWGKENANELSGLKTINMVAEYDGLTEFPVIQVQKGSAMDKLDVDNLSADQIINVLEQAHEAEFGAIQIMFHSFTFMKLRGMGKPIANEDDRKIYGADTADMKKFEKILKYISESDDMEIVTFRELAESGMEIPKDTSKDKIFALK